MNQKLIIGVIAIIVVAGGIGIYSSSNSKSEMARKDAMIQKERDAMAEQKAKEVMVKEVVAKEVVAKEVMVKEVMTKGATMTKDSGVMVKNEGGAMMTKAGSYEAYSPEKIAIATAKGNAVLNFSAAWCPKCRSLDADIKANFTNIPTNLTILKVDYDNSSDLKKKYGVTYQHTFVQVDAQGNLIKKWSGSPTLVALVSEVK